MTQYVPPNFLLAQETHFFAGLAFLFAGPALGFPWWYGAALILVVDLVKELTFDRVYEHQPFFPGPPAGIENSGLVDWVFYWLGTGAGLLVLVIGKTI